ncbi:MAG: hypothetical protein R2695_21420 [Acidimicrobiales bacterium]
MLTSVIVSVFVLVAGIGSLAGPRPPWGLQPAMAVAGNDGAPRRRPARARYLAAMAVSLDRDSSRSIVMDSLRVLGVVRSEVRQPVVGRNAYVRTWERIRAVIVLGAIVIGLGLMLAAAIGLIVLAAGFLLEQAIA